MEGRRVWERDPSGRYPFRARVNGKWTNWASHHPDGSAAVDDPDGGRKARETAAGQKGCLILIAALIALCALGFLLGGSGDRAGSIELRGGSVAGPHAALDGRGPSHDASHDPIIRQRPVGSGGMEGPARTSGS